MAINFSDLGGGGSTAGFLVQMGDATQTTTVLDQSYPAGGYNVSLAIDDASFDVYGLDVNGVLSGYSNSGSIIFETAVESIVIYGSVPNQIYTFAFTGTSSAASSTGGSAGAGAFITLASPLDLPNDNDATVIGGGNFDSDLTVQFLGTNGVAYEAKSVTVTSSTVASVVRPDGLVNDHAPYTLVVKNADTPSPTGTNVNVLPSAITLGLDPVWVTTTYVTPFYEQGNSYSAFIEATDPEGSGVTYSVVDGLLQSGLSLDSTTGEISGITTLLDTRQITFRATDQGGNSTDQVLMVGYQGAFTTSSAPYAVKTESYTYSYVAAIAEEVNNFAVNYTLDGWTFNNILKPSLTVIRGEKYQFSLTSSGHPFSLQTTPGPYDAANTYTTGVTSSGIQVGNVDWTVDAGAPATLYYADSNDATNFGTVNVIAQPSPAIGTPVYTVSSGTLPSGMSLSTDGILSGAPTSFGLFNLTIRATFAGQSFTEEVVSFQVYDIVILNFTSSQTFTPSSNVTGKCYVIGGGGSGGRLGSDYSAQASGGNAGSMTIATRNFVSGTSYSITVGSGGAAVSGGPSSLISGNDGSSSSISGGAITSISAQGGGAGQYNGQPNGTVYFQQEGQSTLAYDGFTPSQNRGGAGIGGSPITTNVISHGSSGQAGIGRTFGGTQFGGGGGTNGGYQGGGYSASFNGGSGSGSGTANTGGGGGGRFGSSGFSGSGGSGLVRITYAVIT
jgi:hypothetical protein